MTNAAVRAEHLTVRFGDFTAVDDVSFDVAPGEIFGFLGANGAGKTTTIRALCGLIEPTSGRVVVAGHDASLGLTPIKLRVGYMSQRFTLYDDMTVSENMAFTAALRKIPDVKLRQRKKELFGLVGFEQSESTMVRDLAGGFRQELSLAAAMLHDPEIVFLDEPTAGVAPAARARFWRLIRRIADSGKTVFVTTHYMDEAEQCGRIALMRAGKLVALDSPQGLKKSTFPEKLYELTPSAEASRATMERVRADSSILDVKTYGLHYHISVRDEAGFDRLVRDLGANVETREIAPSLEDVFIRLVEGKDR